MIRQLLTRRPRHVSCTPLPTNMCYSQAPTATLGAKLDPWKEMAAVHPEPGPNSSKINSKATTWYTKVTVRPEISSQTLHADVRDMDLKVENGLLKIRNPRSGKTNGVHEVSKQNAGGPSHFVVPGRWLRDNCACPKCRNAETAQRQINVFKNADAGKVANVVEHHTDDKESTTFEVTFADGHSSVFSKQFINDRRSDRVSSLRNGTSTTTHWDSTISCDPPTVEYESIQQSNGMATLLAKVREFGFCFVDNMPATPDATQRLLEQIGPIRNTHYGGFYDFTSDLSSKDTAYTSESLEPHTDTTYFTDPIGLQALHLLSHTDGSGGLSSLVDGFNMATRLFKEDFDAYKTLSRVRLFAHASGNEGVGIQPAHAFPIFNHTPGKIGHLMQVRWNTADRAGINADLGPSLEAWYDAAMKFDALVSDPKNQYWFQLKPGKMLLFDNWRVLHGRSAFTGKRRMCGGYISRDDFISKYRMTNLTKEEIAASTVTG